MLACLIAALTFVVGTRSWAEPDPHLDPGASPDATSDAEGEELPERIVILAPRRSRALSDAPMSVTALSAKTLDAAGVEGTSGLAFVTPGLVFTTNTTIGQPYLRGVGSDLITAGADPAVATIVDGVYQARSAGSLQEFFDVERVEVQKGPQGTLYGRNATGGAIQLYQREPEDDVGGHADFVYGNFDKVRLRAAINAPVVDERAFLRVAGIWNANDGYARNEFLGNRVDDERFGAVRAKLRVEASQDVSLLLSGDYQHDRSSRFLPPKLREPLAGSPAAQAGGTVPDDPRRLFLDVDPQADVERWGAHGRIRWERDAFSLSSLTAYRVSRWSQRLDLDATEIDFLSNFPEEDSSTVTQEFQLRSEDESPLEWLAGLFYLHEDAEQSLDVRITPAGIRDQPGADLETDAVGVFGEVGYSLGEHWKTTAGLRYSYERKRQDFSELINGVEVAAFRQEDDWDAWTPRFALEYRPVEGVLGYATISRGFRSGGYNSGVAQPFAFDPEFLWAYQAGVRWSTWEDRAHLHVAAFYYDYEDIQLQVVSPTAPSPFPLVVNAGSARLWGIEAELVVRPVGGLQLEGSLAFLDAEFDDLNAVDPNDPDPAASTDQSGNRMPKAPRFSAWVAAEYRWTPLQATQVRARVDYRYQSLVYFDIFQDKFASQSAFGTVNAQLMLEFDDGRLELGVFGRNLSDELYATSNIRLDGAIGNLFLWGAPRTFGVQLGFRY